MYREIDYEAFIKRNAKSDALVGYTSYQVSLDFCELPPLAFLKKYNVKTVSNYNETVVIEKERYLKFEWLRMFESISHIEIYTRDKSSDSVIVFGKLCDAQKHKMSMKLIQKIKDEYLPQLKKLDKIKKVAEIPDDKLWLVTTKKGIDQQVENLITYNGVIYWLSDSGVLCQHDVYFNKQAKFADE